MNGPRVPMDSTVSVEVKVGHATLLSTVHEPGDPVSGWLQCVNTDSYLAIEFESSDAIDEVIDRLIDLSATLAEAEDRLNVFAETVVRPGLAGDL